MCLTPKNKQMWLSRDRKQEAELFGSGSFISSEKMSRDRKVDRVLDYLCRPSGPQILPCPVLPLVYTRPLLAWQQLHIVFCTVCRSVLGCDWAKADGGSAATGSPLWPVQHTELSCETTTEPRNVNIKHKISQEWTCVSGKLETNKWKYAFVAAASWLPGLKSCRTRLV